MKIIALAQQKGGCMKSGLAVHLAVEALRQGLPSLVLELDKQGTASFWAEQRGDKAPRVRRIESVRLAKSLADARQAGFEVVVLDLPGAHSPAVTPAIKAADFVLIPAKPCEVDIAASAETLAAAQRLKRPHAYVLTFVPSNAGRADEARDALLEAGHHVLSPYIGDRKIYADALASGSSAQERETNGIAAKEIGRLWSSLVKQMGAQDEQPKDSR